MLLPIAIATFRKNWSLPPMNSQAGHRDACGPRAAAARVRSKSELQAATLRWCISSPIVRPRAISGFSATGAARSGAPSSGPELVAQPREAGEHLGVVAAEAHHLAEPFVDGAPPGLPATRFSTTSSGMLRVVMPVIGPTAPK